MNTAADTMIAGGCAGADSGGTAPARGGLRAEDLMHGVDWNGRSTIEGMMAQEKYDGIRAVWTGAWLMSRGGHRIDAPDYFLKGLPELALDMELVYPPEPGSIVPTALFRRGAEDPRWRQARLRVFDVIVTDLPFERRCRLLPAAARRCAFAEPVRTGPAVSREALESVLAGGGEGLVLRAPESLYVAGRTRTMLKVKRGALRWL